MSSSKDDKPEPIAFGDQDLSDVTLVVGEQEFRVQKMTLASRSGVFKDLFYVKEVNKDRVEIKDVYPAAFQHLLELLYNGAIGNRDQPIHTYYIDRGLERLILLLTVAENFKLSQLVMQELNSFRRIPQRPNDFRRIPFFQTDFYRCSLTIAQVVFHLYQGDPRDTRKYSTTEAVTIANLVVERGWDCEPNGWNNMQLLGRILEHLNTQ